MPQTIAPHKAGKILIEHAEASAANLLPAGRTTEQTIPAKAKIVTTTPDTLVYETHDVDRKSRRFHSTGPSVRLVVTVPMHPHPPDAHPLRELTKGSTNV
jgi:hypothetical protein